MNSRHAASSSPAAQLHQQTVSSFWEFSIGSCHESISYGTKCGCREEFDTSFQEIREFTFRPLFARSNGPKGGVARPRNGHPSCSIGGGQDPDLPSESAVGLVLFAPLEETLKDKTETIGIHQESFIVTCPDQFAVTDIVGPNGDIFAGRDVGVGREGVAACVGDRPPRPVESIGLVRFEKNACLIVRSTSGIFGCL